MDTYLKCRICKKTFTQKSSLVRHSKRCTPGPAPSLRQKSCRQCTNSKTKCDLRRPKCSRCEQRDTLCEYIVPMTRGIHFDSSTEDQSQAYHNEAREEREDMLPMEDIPVDFSESLHTPFGTGMGLNPNSSYIAFGFAGNAGETNSTALNTATDKDPFVKFPWDLPTTTDILSDPLTTSTGQYELVAPYLSSESSPDNSDFTFDDWLLWNPVPPQTTPALPRHSMETLLRVMKTWPKVLVKGFQNPPIFHVSHTSPGSILWPTKHCVAIAKSWTSQDVGSSEIVRQTVIQEMRSLFEQYRSMDERHLLATLQALVMYMVMLMFPGKGQMSVSLVDPAIFLCIQRVVLFVANTGLLLTEERDSKRPSWESWVHVTAKRRAVLTLYTLHWAYSVYHGLKSFSCSQLGFMPAPAPKFLWQCESREKWEDLYGRWLEQWDGRPYTMHDLEKTQSGPYLDERTEKWVEDADELGILILSIVNATDRGNPMYNNAKGMPFLPS